MVCINLTADTLGPVCTRVEWAKLNSLLATERPLRRNILKCLKILNANLPHITRPDTDLTSYYSKLVTGFKPWMSLNARAVKAF